MHKLIFTSYSYYQDTPKWVSELSAHPTAKANNYCVYDPKLGITEEIHNLCNTNIETQISHLMSIIDPCLINKDILSYIKDDNSSINQVITNDYILIRSSVLIVDLDYSSSKINHDITLASLLNIPVIGVLGNFLVDPFNHYLTNVISKPSVDEIIKQIITNLMYKDALSKK